LADILIENTEHLLDGKFEDTQFCTE